MLLALATVATAWSGYQASRWNGEQAKAFSRANAARIESTRASALADAQTQIDVATFTQWVDAYAQHQTAWPTSTSSAFAPSSSRQWTPGSPRKPQQNPNAPLTPFAMPQYQLAARVEAKELEAKADALSAEAGSDVQRATDYVLGVVLFAATLFFAGMSAKLRTRRLRVVLLTFGVAFFVGTIAWIATFPVSIST